MFSRELHLTWYFWNLSQAFTHTSTLENSGIQSKLQIKLKFIKCINAFSDKDVVSGAVTQTSSQRKMLLNTLQEVLGKQLLWKALLVNMWLYGFYVSLKLYKYFVCFQKLLKRFNLPFTINANFKRRQQQGNGCFIRS